MIKVSLRERFHTYTRASLSVLGTNDVPCSANQALFVTARPSLACATSISRTSAEAHDLPKLAEQDGTDERSGTFAHNAGPFIHSAK